MASNQSVLDLDDGVVQGLYQAAAGMLPWNAALERLDAAVGSVVSQLVVFDKTNGRAGKSTRTVACIGKSRHQSWIGRLHDQADCRANQEQRESRRTMQRLGHAP